MSCHVTISALHTPHSTLHTTHYTLHTTHSTNPPPLIPCHALHWTEAPSNSSPLCSLHIRPASGQPITRCSLSLLHLTCRLPVCSSAPSAFPVRPFALCTRLPRDGCHFAFSHLRPVPASLPSAGPRLPLLCLHSARPRPLSRCSPPCTEWLLARLPLAPLSWRRQRCVPKALERRALR
jgi:hypothetical protein